MIGSGVVMWLLCEKHEFANWVATLAVFGTLVFIISLLFVRLGWFETGRWSISDYKNKTSQIASSCDMSSGRLPPQEEGFRGFMRSVRGRDQEKVGRKKEELWGRRCSAWFVIALWPLTPRRGPCERWRGRLNSLSERLLYMSDYVCNDTTEDRQWSTTQDLFFHRWAENPVISLLFFSFFFFAQTLWLHMWKATPYTVSMQCNGWWIHGSVSVQSHQTCSDSVGDVNIHLMDFLPKPSCFQFRVIQNVVLMPPRIIGRRFCQQNINNPELEEIVATFCMNLDSRGLEPLWILNSVALMLQKLEIWKVQSEAC